ncbi:MAG: hypothetical protein V3V08_20750 [Nannocystaceae bacterium]
MKLLTRFYQANGHIKLAVVLAPLLAIGGYILAGSYAESKVAAQPSAAKQMALQRGCQLLSGVCELLHREIAANVGIEDEQGEQVVYLATSVALRGALISVGDARPVAMVRRGTAKRWMLNLDERMTEDTVIRLVLAAEKHSFFAEVPAMAPRP